MVRCATLRDRSRWETRIGQGMRRLLIVITVIASLTLAACGGGSTSSSTTASPIATVADGPPSHSPTSDQPPAHPKTGKAQVRKNADLCFKPGALTVDAGESFSGIEPGQSFPGRSRIIQMAIHSAVLPTVRAELQAAERHADSMTNQQVRQVESAAKQGMRQVSRNPNLLVSGHISGFARAQSLIERYHLSRC
jgi:hypothetical protein